jgi:hypothetical protein
MSRSRLLVCIPGDHSPPIVAELTLLNLQGFAGQLEVPPEPATGILAAGTADTWDACWARLEARCKFARQFASVADALQAVSVRRGNWSMREHRLLLAKLRARANDEAHAALLGAGQPAAAAESMSQSQRMVRT